MKTLTKLLLTALLLLLLPVSARAAIVCGNEASVGTQPPAANPQTLSWTPDAGSNRVAIVAVGYADIDADNTTATVSSSAGGTWTQYAFVNEESGTTDLVSYLFYSTDFADGAQTLSVTHSTNVTWGMVAAYTCTGVRVSDPFRGAATTGTANTSTIISLSVPSAVGDLVIDNAVGTGLGAGEAPAVGAGQTQMYNVVPSGNDNGDMSGSTEPGAAGNVTMSWTAIGSERWSSVAGSLVPASDAAGPLRRRTF